ncbi:PIN domain-containing protein [Thermococcus sp. 18S1]|uniref:PIN domain-containing protein n=1 Tax=Thermococcus sp. 18S1 TaxID=1638210 RepID=UPI001438EBF7|nr:PIN domain-containing protein [Thermococcus sp. 18S1]NJE30360.1 PIN domain-containing protein [Thermococcus sp. 18S1]
MKVVLDTSVIAKALMKPRRSLPQNVLERELKTHEKARLVVKLCDSHDVSIPLAGLVEVASVLRRNGHSKVIHTVIESLSVSYEIVQEELIFETALDVASQTGASGFDTYFIALALLKDALLITDDLKMFKHSTDIGIKSVLLRDTTIEDLQELLKP